MLEISKVIKQSNERFNQEVFNAENAKKIDHARLHRRRNETYFSRLTKACLPSLTNIELSDPCYSFCVACPELLFSKMYYLCWGQGRKQTNPEQSAPQLLDEYNSLFINTTNVAHFVDLLSYTKKQIKPSSLICHGLSPTSDTLLLLADIGRNIRISYALGVSEINVMLADLSWIKHNRSINQLMSKKDFLNSLRICLDKRKRLYRALGFKYKVFGINNFGREDLNINRTALEKLTAEFRQLAQTLWGEQSLQPHDQQIKKIIGKKLYGMRPDERGQLPSYIDTLVSYQNLAESLERELESQLGILRTVSELFSTFDEEIFFYYFAQFFAQQKFNNYFKIAPISEIKFDLPFETQKVHFLSVTTTKANSSTSSENNKPYKKITKQSSQKTCFNFYFPQYKLGKYELLPYTSISGDVIKKRLTVDEFLSSTILIEDSYENKIEKIIGVITETPIPCLNRLVSDLLSFIHFLMICPSIQSKTKILEHSIIRLDPQIAEQIFSVEDTPNNYSVIFADWLKAIDKEGALPPFHIIPYLWEDADWNKDKIQALSQLTIELIRLVNEICD